MRHYDRVNYRHLNDSERYRDHEYLADDAWVGPNERVPPGMLDARQTFERGAHDEHDRGYARPRALPHHLDYPREGVAIDERPPPTRRMQRHPLRDGVREGVREVMRSPGSFVRRVVTGIFHGRGPKNWLRSDTRIHDEACELLARHSDIDATDIEVVVKNGEVILTGMVDDRRTKRHAEDVVEQLPGVKDVQNQLRVGDRTDRGNQGAGSAVGKNETESPAPGNDKKNRA